MPPFFPAQVPYLFFLFFLALVVVALIQRGRQTQQHLQALAQLAVERGGRVKRQGLFGQPSLDLEVLGVVAELAFSGGGKNSPRYTNLEFTFPDRISLEVRVVPEHFFSRLGKIFGLQDIQTGDKLFDEKFLIKGRPPEMVLNFLNPAVREAIFMLRALRMNNHLEIVSRSDEISRLRISKMGWLTQMAHLREFVDLSQHILQGYLQATGQAVTEPPAAEQPINVPAPALCPACGDEVVRADRPCPRCGVRQHDACWRLTDCCGACGFPDERS